MKLLIQMMIITAGLGVLALFIHPVKGWFVPLSGLSMTILAVGLVVVYGGLLYLVASQE